MNRRHIVTILACAAVVFACAPRTRVASADDSHKPTGTTIEGASGLAVSLTQTGDSSAAMFALEVKNGGKLTEVRFANGKTHDFVVLDDSDREVWRWSTGRLFTQSMQTRQLKSGSAIRYVAKWDTAAPGHYRVVASLNSATHPEQIATEFVVR